MTEQETELLHNIEKLTERMYASQASTSAKVWDIATKLAVPAVLGLIGWIWSIDKTQSDYETRLRIIETSRFSSRDGLDMERRLQGILVETLSAQTQAISQSNAQNSSAINVMDRTLSAVATDIGEIKRRISKLEESK